MDDAKYLLIDASILPEVYSKVVTAKNLLLSGEAQSVSQASKMAGISRSAYYKYKDKIIEYKNDLQGTATFNARLQDNAGVLSSVMNEIYLAGANVLSINQSSPVNDIANVSITVSLSDSALTTEEMVNKIKEISGVKSAELIQEA
ncbi:MAG: ACT domain-containing protein [Ruminococcaceae bacterium]|nr:ACT domain-containing protein [Oscillospiraceae bacterium]